MSDVEMANVEGMTAMPVTAYPNKRAGRCSKLSPYAKPVTIAGLILVVGIVALIITITSGGSTESKSNDEAAEMDAGFGMDIGTGQYYSSPEMGKRIHNIICARNHVTICSVLIIYSSSNTYIILII